MLLGVKWFHQSDIRPNDDVVNAHKTRNSEVISRRNKAELRLLTTHVHAIVKYRFVSNSRTSLR